MIDDDMYPLRESFMKSESDLEAYHKALMNKCFICMKEIYPARRTWHSESPEEDEKLETEHIESVKTSWGNKKCQHKDPDNDTFVHWGCITGISKKLEVKDVFFCEPWHNLDVDREKSYEEWERQRREWRTFRKEWSDNAKPFVCQLKNYDEAMDIHGLLGDRYIRMEHLMREFRWYQEKFGTWDKNASFSSFDEWWKEKSFECFT